MATGRICSSCRRCRYHSKQRRPEDVLTEHLTDLEFNSAMWCSMSAELVALEILGDFEGTTASNALPESQRMVLLYVGIEGSDTRK
jgi:hypothetical protein